MKAKREKSGKRYGKLWIILSVILVCCLGIFAFFRLSSWPSAMILRLAFESDIKSTNKMMEEFVPEGISAIRDIQYVAGDSDAYLDVYYPEDYSATNPTIVWVHGGGWLAGSRNSMEYWGRILAGEGFSVVVVGYSLAPENRYPLPVKQVNSALEYLDQKQVDLKVNMDKLVLAGSSAGAQISAQIALIHTSPDYAENLGILPTLSSDSIKGLLLNCGPYDMDLVNPESSSLGARLVRTMLWAYTGDRNFSKNPESRLMSIPQNMTADFPPSFVTAGNADPLLPHSISLISALEKNQVAHETLFFPDDYTPAAGHEYQYQLDTDAGQEALQRMTLFAKDLF